MNFSDLKAAISSLSAKEQAELAIFTVELTQQNLLATRREYELSVQVHRTFGLFQAAHDSL